MPRHHHQHPLPLPVRIDPDGLIVGAGVTAVLQMLLFVLTDKDDAVLIPAPYFTGYDADVSDPRISVKAVPVFNPTGLVDVDAGTAPLPALSLFSRFEGFFFRACTRVLLRALAC